MKKFYQDDSAVSIAVGFILTFTITILTFTAIMNSSYLMMEQTEENVMREEFEIHGNNIALQLTEMDAMILIADSTGGSVEEMQSELLLPLTIASEYYTVEFSNSTSIIIFESKGRDQTRSEVPYNLESSNIESKTITSASGDHYLLYNSTSNLIEVY
ncbi:hypothetical protein J2755_001979 [Methanohalophilus levihalophilus]|uniref:DUF7266 family protein n=1 Tax=Methanohalophilus levihalophilus TaxID=1431282 RepID=UPI001AE215C1|nr:hypothetical protein [Methanohalophilus levihalophilus]MBP2031031.1 hypothetical protein [Methanohalophilus levihalophilus]